MSRISQQQLESYLWGAATLLRGTIDAGDYKQFIFPLLFYKRVCDVFDEETGAALKESGGDAEFAQYPENHRFQVPSDAQWAKVRHTATNVGRAIQEGMRAIETANPDKLFGIFGDAQWTNKDRLSDAMLRDLVEHFNTLDLTLANLPEDELGQGYEYLIKKFADDAGHTAAEFYTNRTVVHLMTEMLEPEPGESIYDPTCGSGGMLLSCITHLRQQGKEWRNVRLYGQERNLMTSSIARMNCFLHGIEDFRIERGDTLAEPKFVQGDRLMQFDVVLANPPYSIKQWDRDAFASDLWGRNLYGTPPQGRADYAFWQHIVCSLKPKTGRCAILFPHGVLFRQEEADMRRKLIEADVIECVLGLGPNLFYNSPMEACVVICRTGKPKGRKGRILLINAVNEVTRERTQSFLTDDHIEHIVKAYERFTDEPGFARVVTVDDIRTQDWSINLSLYVVNADHRRTEIHSSHGSLEGAFVEWFNGTKGVRESLCNLVGALEARPLAGLGKLTVKLPAWLDKSKWQRLPFGQIAERVRETGQPTPKDSTAYIGLEHMDSGSLHVRRWGSEADLKGQKLRMHKGDILFAKRNAYLRRVAIAPHDGFFSAHGMILRPKPEVVLPEFLPFLMTSDRFMNRAVAISVGSLSPTINWTMLDLQEFDLPPLNQQRRIAEMLWAVDEASEWQLKLRSDLTEHLRALRRSLYIGNKFKMVQVRDVGDKTRQVVQVGPFGGSLCNRHFVPDGVPVVKVNNITADNAIDLTGAVFVSKAHASSLSRYGVRAGDILIAAQGDTTGRSGLAGEESNGAIISQHLARVAVDTQLCRPQFLAEVFRADELQRQVDAVKTKTTRPGLNTDDVAAFAIPLPALDEQDRFCDATRSSTNSIKACTEAIASGKDLCAALISAFTSL